MSVAFHGIYSLILTDFKETNMDSMYSMHIMDHLTFVTSPHITAAIKPINPLTDNRHNGSTNVVSVSSTIHRLCGISGGSVLSVAQWTWYAHVDSGSAERGRTSGKCRFVRSIMIFTVYRILFSLTNEKRKR
jgi:hypothetical protein